MKCISLGASTYDGIAPNFIEAPRDMIQDYTITLFDVPLRQNKLETFDFLYNHVMDLRAFNLCFEWLMCTEG